MTLRLPLPPPVEGFAFRDLDAYETRQTLGTEIKAVCDTLAKSTVIPAYQEMFRRFKAVVEPGGVPDPARLPYPASGPNERKDGATAMGCVYARLSWVIQRYWRAGDPGEIGAYLAELLDVAEVGFFKCKVIGNPKDGYWLESPK